MPEDRHIQIGQAPQNTPLQHVLVFDPGVSDLSMILHHILKPLNSQIEARVVPLVGGVPGPEHSVVENHEVFDAMLALGDGLRAKMDGHYLSGRIAAGPVVSPGSASLRAIQALGLPLNRVGFVAEHWARHRSFSDAIWAAVEPDDPGRYGVAVSQLPDAEALVLYSLAFSEEDRAMFSQISRRPVILLRNAMTAELGTLLASPALNNNSASQGSQPTDHRRVQLTPRERQVLRQLRRGLSSKEIAAELVISPRTVDIYRSNLLTKMRARNTRQLLYILQSENMTFD